MTSGSNSFKNATAHKVNCYYTLAISYCTFCVGKHTISGPGVCMSCGLYVTVVQAVTEIAATERSIVDLKKAIKSKENEVKVCQTRLYLRERRPNVEQCRDPVHYQSVVSQSLLYTPHYVSCPSLCPSVSVLRGILTRKQRRRTVSE